ncbi:2,4-dihydroxyhept-2-ene-1,7-dioic acid aldolase [Lophium mytilinum]|uniref:2,4-dihydroxyhept-2-ene-1,7-dioic acid aldolase n=1 Tax=Lophium mytilinum TaxID=390894 RepID=A0A6A6QU98_9PEZI|nr:2,4-dihydroxyhept-2-ene-1,7-dioic acid aldolase [Lophium mytilinum]
MQSASRLHKALKKGGATFGAWQMLPGANISKTLAITGVDWICVDTEHGNIDDAQMHEAVTAVASFGISPVVRIAANEAWMVKRALDSGAHGIIVPLLYTPEDARRLVSSAKFPPLGTRGFGSPFAPNTFIASTSPDGPHKPVALMDYLQQANGSLVTIVQIETAEALANVDAIAAIDGIDVLLIGPFDLGNNIGRPILAPELHPELKEAIAKIHAAAGRHGKGTGIYCTGLEQAKMYQEHGFHMISICNDVGALSGFFGNALQILKPSSGAAGGEVKY